METWQKILIGAGVVGAAGAAYWFYKKRSLEDDEWISPDNDADEIGDDSLPTDARTPGTSAIAAFQNLAESASGPGIKATFAPSIVDLGTLKVKANNPECRIMYDVGHYKGTRLASLFKNNQIVSYTRGNDIMRVQTNDGPPFWYEGSNFISPTKAIYYAKKNSVTNAMLNIDYIVYKLANVPLESVGFKRIPVVAGQYKSIKLAPGDYWIIIEPDKDFVSNWSYIRGFWEWTNKGPFSKECKVQLDRFIDEIKNTNCEKRVTKFKRVAGPTEWSDVAFDVKIRKDQTTTKALTPKTAIQISNRKYEKNEYSWEFYGVCAGATVMNYVSEGAVTGLLMPILKKLLGLWGKCS